MSGNTKVFAGREFQHVDGEGIVPEHWMCPLDNHHHVTVREVPGAELWMLFNSVIQREAVAIDLIGVEVVLRDWFARFRIGQIQTRIANQTATT